MSKYRHRFQHAGTPRFYDAVRLVNGSGSYQGRVEVLHQGTWLPVCRSGSDYSGNPSDGSTFDNLAAAVVCNQLGYTTLPTSVEAANSFGTPSSNSSGEFFLSSGCGQVQGVPRLDQCPQYAFFDRSCYSFAAVTCANTSGGAMAGQGLGEAGGGSRHS